MDAPICLLQVVTPFIWRKCQCSSVKKNHFVFVFLGLCSCLMSLQLFMKNTKLLCSVFPIVETCFYHLD